MCDSTVELVTGLKSDLNQIRQQRDKILNEQNDFFNRFYTDTHFTFQQDPYQINISDSDEEEEQPTRMRIMTMRTQTIFEKKPKKKKDKPLPEQVVQLPPPVIKPICIDRSSQSKKIELRTLETQTSIKSTYKDAETIATANAEVQTHSIRLRTEATNTDSVLPSYENVCIAFLESLLEDAPVFINSGPKPEQLEGILMDFLNQLIRDAKDFDNQQLDSNSQSGQSAFSNGSLIKRPKLVDANIQQEVQMQTIATQSPVSLKVLENPSVIINYIPPPDESHEFVGNFVTNPTCFDIPPTDKFRLVKLRKGDNFTLPPSLRIEPEKPPIKMVNISTSPQEMKRKETQTETEEVQRKIPTQTETKKPHKNMLQIDVLENQNVSVKPDQQQDNQPPGSSYLPIQMQPQQQQQQQQQPLAQKQNKQQQKQIPELHHIVIHPLDDIEELSEFNLDSYLKDLNSSSSDNDDDIADSSNTGGTGDYSIYDDGSINESTIEKALNSSSVTIGASVSEDPPSEGEIRDFEYADSNDDTYGSETGTAFSYRH